MKIKICGLRRTVDADYVNEFLPDYIGFILSKGFRRTVSLEKAQEIAEKINPKIKKTGVFVNDDIEYILEYAEKIPLDIIQLHGDEDNDFINQLRKRTDLKIWKAFKIKNESDLINAENSAADIILLDTFEKGKAGGTGVKINTDLIKKHVPKRDYILAGGINKENIEEVIDGLNPVAVDVSSGAETDGVKDAYKIGVLVKKIRNYKPNNPNFKIFMDGGKSIMNKKGRFGEYGGQYVPETVMNAVHELEAAYDKYKDDKEFNDELNFLLKEYAGRPSLLYYAKKMTEDLGGCKIYLKREDLNHTGAHKINNALGQVLLAKKMGKKRVIAETGAGQHGVATATCCALLGLDCEVYMGVNDMKRQALNVYRMELLGAKVTGVSSSTGVLKDAINEAMRDWATNIDTTFYCIGSVMGPHPYPTMVRNFQKVIGEEAKKQILEKEGKLPDCVVACVGGGSNAIGAFYDFIPDKSVRLVGAEAAGRGVNTPYNAATVANGSKGIFHGMKSLFLQNDEGQIDEVYSISAGLDYPGIGPEHTYLNEIGRADYVDITDEEAVQAFEYLSRTEGIIPAIESAHAVAAARKIAPTMGKDQIMIICLSGRGDKDVQQVAKYRGVKLNEQN